MRQSVQSSSTARCACAAGAKRALHGFALIPALFLIVVLGALAVVAIRVGTGQQQAVIMALEEARALAAAQAGMEWGAYQALNGSCVASTALNLTEAALNGFAVVVTCAATSFANGAATSSSYVLTSTATTGTYGQPGYVRRVVSGTYTNAT
jgi:MSHA biogenesis protein MshP